MQTGVMRNKHNSLATWMARIYSQQVHALEKTEALAERVDERASIDKELREMKERAAELKERKKSLMTSGTKPRTKKAPAYSIAGDSSGRAPTLPKMKSKPEASMAPENLEDPDLHVSQNEGE